TACSGGRSPAQRTEYMQFIRDYWGLNPLFKAAACMIFSGMPACAGYVEPLLYLLPHRVAGEKL
ncbi:MAG: hypothetical protein D6681_01130, partial [Calditrichaeota bacterium]